jgi:hypothetical protein
VAEDEIARTKKRGQPDDWKRGREIILAVGYEVAGYGDITEPTKRGRRTKGSVTKEKNVEEVSSEGEITRPKKRGRASLTNELGPALCTRNKLRSIGFEGYEHPGMSSDVCLEDDDGTANVLPSSLEITTSAPSCDEQEKGIPSEATKHIENIIAQRIVKRGRPKGSPNKEKKLGDQDLPVQTLGPDEVQNVKPKMGRPKGSKNRKKNIAGGAESELHKEKKRRGRPKGSGEKQKEIVVQSDLKIERRGRPKGSRKKQKKAAARLASQIKSQKSTCVDGVLSMNEESISPPEGQVNKEEKSDFVPECSKDSRIEKRTKGLMSASSNVHKRCSERLRTLQTDHKNYQDFEVEETFSENEVEETFSENEVEETIDHDGLESTDLMVRVAL